VSPSTTGTGPARPLVGWVVDVQNDFMLPTGRLYVHDLADPTDIGATQVTDEIVRAVDWMRSHCAVVVYTGDWHAWGDREIDADAPDAARGTYPPHCMGASPDAAEREGAAILGIIAPDEDRMLVLPRGAGDAEARALARQAVAERRPVFIHKFEFSVFEGAPADAFLAGLDEALETPPAFVTCGVATDVCVRQAVEGLLDRGRPVQVVTDATWGLGLSPAGDLFEAWARRGATLTTTDALPGGTP
jgi:nicotinamidase/pyrazinamidase